MSQIKTKFLEANAVDDTKVKLRNNQYLRARNAADSADVSVVKVNASDVIEFASFPQKSGTPANNADLVNKLYVDTEIAGVTAPVASVNGQTGVVVLDSDDISEGSTNLYHTTARARSAAVADAINNGTTDIAPSQNAVFDALALKLDVSALPTWNKEALTLNGTDITNQYKDLAQVIKASSLDLVVSGLVHREGTDYTVSLTGGAGGNTRITFAGDLATGGNAALISGDVIHFKYQY